MKARNWLLGTAAVLALGATLIFVGNGDKKAILPKADDPPPPVKDQVEEALKLLESMTELPAREKELIATLRRTKFVEPAGLPTRLQKATAAVANLSNRTEISVTSGAGGHPVGLALTLLHEADHVMFAPPGLKGAASTTAQDMFAWLAEELRVHTNDIEREELVLALLKDDAVTRAEIRKKQMMTAFSVIFYRVKAHQLRVQEVISALNNRYVAVGKAPADVWALLSEQRKFGDQILSIPDADDWAHKSDRLGEYFDAMESLSVHLTQSERDVVKKAKVYFDQHREEFKRLYDLVLANNRK